MTDLPDAVVEAAAEGAWRGGNPDAVVTWAELDPFAQSIWRDRARAALAAASGPWEAHLEAKWAADKQSEIARLSEHLDAARPECTRAYCAIFDDWQKIAAERDAALARNAELVRDHGSEQSRVGGLMNENAALRAELDNLRDRVTALADEWEPKFPVAGTLIGGELPAYERLRAIVRGSDDAGEDE